MNATLSKCNIDGSNRTLQIQTEKNEKMKISCYIWYKTWKRKHSNRSKKAYLQVHNDKKVRTKIAQHACIRCNR